MLMSQANRSRRQELGERGIQHLENNRTRPATYYERRRARWLTGDSEAMLTTKLDDFGHTDVSFEERDTTSSCRFNGAGRPRTFERRRRLTT
jgi:hypothetical protein